MSNVVEVKARGAEVLALTTDCLLYTSFGESQENPVFNQLCWDLCDRVL